MSDSTSRGRLSSRGSRFVTIALLVVLTFASVTYVAGRIQDESIARATVLIAGGRTFETVPVNEAMYEGVLTVLDNGCVGIRELDRSFVAVWPRGTRATSSADGLEVAGLPEGSTVRFGRRDLTRVESFSLPKQCTGYLALGVLDVRSPP